MVLLAGLDEAGRGPVIGPMVMCGVSIAGAEQKKLQDLGVKDSKLLSEKKREELFDKIREVVTAFEILIVSPEEIDAALRSASSNLNTLEADTSAMILNTLKPDKAILDCPSPNLEAYKNQVARTLSHSCVLLAEHKADLNHPVAAAASILAKVTRDREIVKLKEAYGDIGSGYPSDPKTKEFLSANYKRYPHIFRQTWSSYKKLITQSEQKGIGDFSAEENPRRP